MATTYTITLVDQVSGAASKVTASVDKISDSSNKMKSAVDSTASSASKATGAWTDFASQVGLVKMGIQTAIRVAESAVGAFAGLISITQERAKLEMTFAALGGGAAQGKKVVAMVDELASKLPFATDQLGKWTKGFMAAGLQGAQLKSAVVSVANATAYMGEEGGAAVEKMISKLAAGGKTAQGMIKQVTEGGPKSATLLKEMGLQSKDLAEALGTTPDKLKSMTLNANQLQTALAKALAKKGKDPIEEMSLTWPAMIAKLKDGFFSLFEGLPIKPLMKEISSLFGEFSRGKGVMGVLKGAIQGALGKVIQLATQGIGMLHSSLPTIIVVLGKIGAIFSFAFGIAYGIVMKVVNAFKPLAAHIMKVATAGSSIKGFTQIWKALSVVLGMAGTGFSVMISIVSALIDPMVSLAGFLLQVVGAFAEAIMPILNFASTLYTSVAGAIQNAITALTSMGPKAWEAAGNFVQGWIDGIAAGVGPAIEVVSGLVSKVLGTFKAMLGIHSPSAVMFGIAGHMVSGLTGGLDAGTKHAEKSSAKLGESSVRGVSKGASGPQSSQAKGGGRGGPLIEGGVHIHVGGDSKGWTEVTEAAFASLFERLAIKEGLVPVGG